jgi:hypothetical protein
LQAEKPYFLQHTVFALAVQFALLAHFSRCVATAVAPAKPAGSKASSLRQIGSLAEWIRRI